MKLLALVLRRKGRPEEQFRPVVAAAWKHERREIQAGGIRCWLFCPGNELTESGLVATVGLDLVRGWPAPILPFITACDFARLDSRAANALTGADLSSLRDLMRSIRLLELMEFFDRSCVRSFWRYRVRMGWRSN